MSHTMLDRTENTRFVTSDEKETFEENGYHILRNALAPEDVRLYRDAMARLLLTPEDHPYASRLAATPISPAPPDNPRAIWARFDQLLFDDIFWDLAYHPTVALTVDALIEPDINLYQTN